MNKIKSILTIICLILTVTKSPGASGDFSNRIKTDYYLEQARSKTLDPPVRLAYYDSLLVKQKNTDLRLIIEKGVLLEDIGRYSTALTLYKTIDGKVPADSVSLHCSLALHRAITEYFAGNQSISIQKCYEITTLPKPDSLMYMDVEANRLLVHMFEDSGNIKLSTTYMERAQSAFDKFTNSDAPQWNKELTRGKLHYTNCSLALARKDFPTAFAEIKTAQQLLDKYWPKSYTAINTALIYHIQGEYDVAEEIYRDIINTPDFHPDHATAILNYAELLVTRGETARAVNLLQTYDKEINRLVNTPWELSLYNRCALVYEAAGDGRKSLYYYKKAYDVCDSISNSQNLLYLQHLADKYEGRDVQSQIASLTDENKRIRTTLTIVGVLLVLAAGIAVALHVRSSRQRRKLRETEEKLNRLIDDQTERNQIVQDSLKTKSRELSSMTMRMIRLNEELNNISKHVSNNNLSRDEIITNINSSLKVLSSQDNVWEMFKVYFEEINQKFFDKLFELAPDLTKSEIRLCAFILAGMTTKEIASVTNRSVRTIECIKYNIRRKMNITEPTETFIRRIASEDSGPHTPCGSRTQPAAELTPA